MTEEEKFFSRLARAPNGCIEWTAGQRGGYGRFWFQGKDRQATHVSWFLKHGRWPKEQILHRCDNPPCVKISHLFEGSDAENAADRVAKGRHRSLRGSECSWAKLDELQVAEMRELGKTMMRGEEIAELFGVSASYVSQILTGRIWGPGTGVVKPRASNKGTARIEYEGAMVTFYELSVETGVGQATIAARYARGLRGKQLVLPPHKTPRKQYNRKR